MRAFAVIYNVVNARAYTGVAATAIASAHTLTIAASVRPTVRWAACCIGCRMLT